MDNTLNDEAEKQPQQDETKRREDANEGWTQNEELESVEADEGKDEQKEPEVKEEPAKLSDSEHFKKREKELRDRYSATKGEAETLRKAARKLEADGLLDRDELAKDVGVKRDYLDAVLDKKELPEPGEDGHMEAINKRVDEDFFNAGMQKALTRIYGDQEQQQELAKAFHFSMTGDQGLAQRFQSLKPEDAIYFILDEGKNALDDFREAQAQGGTAKSLASKLREAHARLAELEDASKARPSQANERIEQPTEQILDPLAERDKRLRALRS